MTLKTTCCGCLALLSAMFGPAAGRVYAANAITHQITLPAGQTWCDDTMINGLFSQINTFRGQNAVPALVMDPVGMKDAEMRASQFAIYMVTTPPGSPGFNPHQGYDTTAASLGYNIVSENLAYITTDPNYIVYSVWQDSLHLAAMLATDANVTGVSCVYYQGMPYWSYEPGYSSNPTGGGGGGGLDSEESTFLTLLNNYRAQNGAGPLQISPTLENASTWMAGDMATKNYFSHTDSLGRDPATRLAAFGYTYTPWGENIAAGYSDAQTVLTQWQNACDPNASGTCTYAHRQNMLNPNFKAIGIGRTSGGSYGWYWVTDFGGYLDGGGTAAPTITWFNAYPSVIAAGNTTTLSWGVTGTGTTVNLDNGVGDVSAVTSKIVAPTQTTTYTLTATNSAGSATARVTITVTAATDTQPPSSPTLSASAKSSTQVALSWTASTDNVAVAGYQITRNGVAMAPVQGTSYMDTSAAANTTYTYSVKAYDTAGNYSAASNAVSVTTPSGTSNTCPPAATNAFTGCYYANTTLSGTPALVRTDNQINFDWRSSSPGNGISRTNFSVRWQGNYTFVQGLYTFVAGTSDGMRVYIDGSLILDRWMSQPLYVYYISKMLSQGTHLITVEYYNGSAGTGIAHLSWVKRATSVRSAVSSSMTSAR